MADRFSENAKGCGLLTYSKDDRTAQASHILLSFEDYPDDGEFDGMTMGEALKQKILDGELSFELVAEKFSACASAEKGGDLGRISSNLKKWKILSLNLFAECTHNFRIQTTKILFVLLKNI